mmetsp:Transcript_18369/g.34967  ORF Transcript_18369/g.34967 Transcript_18369/m.34967 type:complete len:116 (+) Transcript_18369:77-424(+)
MNQLRHAVEISVLCARSYLRCTAISARSLAVHTCPVDAQRAEPPEDIGLHGTLDLMGRGDKRTRRGKIFKGSNGKCRPKPGDKHKHKPWMREEMNPLVPGYKQPPRPREEDVPFL